MSQPFPIHRDRAAEAYNAAAQRVERYRWNAKAIRKVAAALDGAFVSSRLEAKVAPLFPDCKVHYYKQDFNGQKFIYIQRPNEIYAHVPHIRIAMKDERHVSAAALIEQAEWYEKNVKTISESLEGFFEYLGQYNVLAKSLSDARGKISAVMYCLDNHGDF